MTMHKTRYTRVEQVLRTSSGSLADTLTHAGRLQRLNAVLVRHLAADIVDHCQAGNLRGHTLVLHTDSAPWATKLRFLAPQLLRELQRERGLARLERIEVRILPQSPVALRPTRTAVPIGKSSREHLLSAARSVRDPRLQAALERLAKS